MTAGDVADLELRPTQGIGTSICRAGPFTILEEDLSQARVICILDDQDQRGAAVVRAALRLQPGGEIALTVVRPGIGLGHIKGSFACIEIRQGAKTLSEPTKLFRELVASGKIVHDGSPLLRWCIANAVQKEDRNENILISKPNKSSSKRIDLLAAILNAMVRLKSLRDAAPPDYVNDEDFGF